MTSLLLTRESVKMWRWNNLFRRAGVPCWFYLMGGIAITLPLILGFSVMAARTDEKLADTGILALVIFRHGQRTPSSAYPLDPYKDESYWPDGWGALTNIGKSNAYSFGEWLRKRYSTLLPENYSEKDINVVSSDVDRCIMSAQLCLAGLYPPKGRQKWNEEILWQPIPVHTVPRSHDKLILLRDNCPKYKQEFEKVKSSMGSNLTELYQILSNHSGMRIMNDVDVETLYNILEIEDDAGLKLPEWTKNVYPANLRNVAVKGQRLFTNTTSMKRFLGGPLIKNIIERITDKISKKNDRKLYLYSAHDMTLLAVMDALGVDYFFKPDPMDALLFEVHRYSEDYQIAISYLNHTGTTRLQDLVINGVEDHIPLVANFIAATKSIVPRDWDKECATTLQL